MSDSDAKSIIGELSINNPKSAPVSPNHRWISQGGHDRQIYIPGAISGLTDPNNPQHRPEFSQVFLASKTLVLDGPNRIGLVKDQAAGDLLRSPTTSFQKLFRDDTLRARYSEIIRKSLDSYATIDPTNLGQLRLKLSPVPPPSPEVERGLSAESVAFHSRAQHIADASDGAKAFAGILAELLAGDPEILLIDEPEAFLHPSLAFNLGREISRALAGTNRRMFVATHSPQFLMGCVQSGVPINVVRLTFRQGNATARLLSNDRIVELMRNPLLRSSGVMSGLFFENVVVTEADTDRAFYQEINERLLRDDRGIPNCLFLNAQNKQTIPTIIAPLRALGIPAAAIYDLDFVKDGGGVATNFMATAGIPELAQNGLTTTRAALAQKLREACPNYKRNGGTKLLNPADFEAANVYFDQLDTYGAFIVRDGELESWLRSLNVTGHGPTWLVSIFAKMGEDPAACNFVRPQAGDVWAFIDKIASWLLNPQRKGVPA